MSNIRAHVWGNLIALGEGIFVAAVGGGEKKKDCRDAGCIMQQTSMANFS